MPVLAALIALTIGATLSIQVGLNSQVRAYLGHAGYAALTNFLVGTIAILLVTLVARPPLPTGQQFAAVPWWAWFGGVLGALYVAASTILGPILGGAALVALVVAGQMAAALVIDHYGLLGFPVHPVNLLRLVGALLVIAGVILLIRR